jgi:hypothetical protein
MNVHRRLLAMGAVAAAAGFGLSGSAAAAFPNFSDCPRTTPGVVLCVDVQNTAGFLDIKGFSVPLGETLEIRGGLSLTSFVPPTGTNGFFARPVQVPGGLLGINFPIPGNAVTATAQLVGPASGIGLNPNDGSLQVPIKLKLDNPLIGPGCSIGSNSNPVRLNLRLTSQGTLISSPGRYTGYLGNVNEDRAFSVPGASSCGLGLGLIDEIVNLKLKLPSSSGNNTMQSVNNIAIAGAGNV